MTRGCNFLQRSPLGGHLGISARLILVIVIFSGTCQLIEEGIPKVAVKNQGSIVAVDIWTTKAKMMENEALMGDHWHCAQVSLYSLKPIATVNIENVMYKGVFTSGLNMKSSSELSVSNDGKSHQSVTDGRPPC